MKLFLVYLFGTAGIFVNYTIYRQNTRKNLLGTKMISDIVWGIHYALISATSGAITCTIAVFREFVFLNKEHKWARSKLWLVAFLVCNAVSVFFTWKGVVSVLPACASIVSIFAFWIGNPKLTRYIQIPISLSFLIYNSVSGSYVGIANEILSLISILTYKK